MQHPPTPPPFLISSPKISFFKTLDGQKTEFVPKGILSFLQGS